MDKDRQTDGQILLHSCLDPSKTIGFIIFQAKQQLDISIRELDLEIIKFDNYGKSFVKKQNISPDSFVQVCVYGLACVCGWVGRCVLWCVGHLREYIVHIVLEIVV